MNIESIIKSNFYSIPGWRTNRHIIVIESDDWGSIRMPSLDTYNKLISSGVKFGICGYERLDTIASKDDLEKLFEVCESFHDINDNPLVITANAVVANPDFQKIKESNFTEYYYEPITTTMERYYPGESPFGLWKEGMNRKVFHPQLHGREHVNVPMWMNSLKQNHPGVRAAFGNGVFSVVVPKECDVRKRNLAALLYNNSNEFEIIKKSLTESASAFLDLFGYRSKSFIAPSYSWSKEFESVLHSIGIKYIQGIALHTYDGKKRFNYIGRSNEYKQIYLNRNAYFEYSQNPTYNWNSDALRKIDIAFRWHKPATICAHRLNFIGALNKNNRDTNLIRFRELISNIQKKWPDVEFMTSDELGYIISKY